MTEKIDISTKVYNTIATAFKVFPRMTISMLRTKIGTRYSTEDVHNALKLLEQSGAIKRNVATIKKEGGTKVVMRFYEADKLWIIEHGESFR